MKKRTQKHLSKEEIVLENLRKEYEKKEAEAGAKRKLFIDTKFMPLVKEITTSLEDAQMVSQVVTQSINTAFQMTSKKMKVGELYLTSQLAKNKPELTHRYERVFKLLEDETIDDSLKMLQGLFDEANRVVSDEMKSKRIEDFTNKENAHEDKTKNSEVVAAKTDKLN